MTRDTARRRPKNRTTKASEPNLLEMDEQFGKAVEREHPRRRRTVEDFQRDIAEIRRKGGYRP